jgi:hypothetical protein
MSRVVCGGDTNSQVRQNTKLLHTYAGFLTWFNILEDVLPQFLGQRREPTKLSPMQQQGPKPQEIHAITLFRWNIVIGVPKLTHKVNR